jgi:transcriptional/translational regulatory protein YebC/TACO1
MAIKDASQVLKEIEELMSKHGLSLIDAAVHWSTKNNAEIEYVGGLIKKNSVLKTRLQVEAEDLNFIKPTENRLPI